MSKTTRATTSQGADTPTITRLRPSARPLNGSHQVCLGEGDIPAHVAPFQAFDWTAGGDGLQKPESPDRRMLREVLNNTINIVSGAVLCLRIAEHCNSVGELSPQMVTTDDGLHLEQPEAPYLSVGEAAQLQTMVATALDLLLNDAHMKTNLMRC